MIETTFICDLCYKRIPQTPDKALRFHRIGSSSYHLTNDGIEGILDSNWHWNVCEDCLEEFQNWGDLVRKAKHDNPS